MCSAWCKILDLLSFLALRCEFCAEILLFTRWHLHDPIVLSCSCYICARVFLPLDQLQRVAARPGQNKDRERRALVLHSLASTVRGQATINGLDASLGIFSLDRSTLALCQRKVRHATWNARLCGFQECCGRMMFFVSCTFVTAVQRRLSFTRYSQNILRNISYGETAKRP